jgi:hypothetical protein
MILVVKNLVKNTEYSMKLNSMEDFEAVAHAYPHAETILLGSKTFKEAAEKIEKYINSTGWEKARLVTNGAIYKAETNVDVAPPNVKLNLNQEEDKKNISDWLKSLEAPPKPMRDRNYIPDPGYRIEQKKDKEKELENGIKQMFKEKK